MTCEESRNLMTGALYNELSEESSNEFHKHCGNCTACSEMFTDMQTTLKVMDKADVSDPGPEFWNSWEEGLKRKMAGAAAATNKPLVHPGFRIPAWSYAIAAVLLVAIGIYLGKSIFSPPPVPAGAAPAAAHMTAELPPDSAQRLALAYIDRSRNVLLGIVNADEAELQGQEFRHQQIISRQLVAQASYLKTALNSPDQQQLSRLVQDLEVILLQLANIEIRPGVPVVELVKQGMDKRSILLKINLEEMKSKTGKKAAGTGNTKSHL